MSWNTNFTRISSVILPLPSTFYSYRKWSHVLPIWEAVGSCEDPARGDQTAPAAENLLLGFATPEYGSNPRVGFHSGNCATHNLHLLPPGAQATCRLCSCGIKRRSRHLRAKAWKWDAVSLVRVEFQGSGAVGSSPLPSPDPNLTMPTSYDAQPDLSLTLIIYLCLLLHSYLLFRKVVNSPCCGWVGSGVGGAGTSRLESFF